MKLNKNDKYVLRALLGVFLTLLLAHLMFGCKSPGKPPVSTTTTTTLVSTTTTTTLTQEPPVKPIIYPSYPKNAGYCTSGNEPYKKCSEGNCFCFASLGKALAGKPVDMFKVNQHAGPILPRDMFRGGSENIPLTCRAVKYIVEKDPRWLEGYFDVQLTDREVGFLGREIFSGTYQALNLGVVLAVRRHADKHNHVLLRSKADEWLKTYWYLVTLMGHKLPMNSIKAYQVDESTGETIIGNGVDDSRAYALVLPMNRAYVNSRAGSGLQEILYSMALGKKDLNFKTSVDQSPGFYGGLCAAAKSLGYPLSAQGKVNFNHDVDPRHFGLSLRDKDLLLNFLSSNGHLGSEQILAHLSRYTIKCNLTIERSDKGLQSFFGVRGQKTPLCARSKGGSFVAVVYNFAKKEGFYLSRARRENKPEPAEVWAEGAAICEQSELLPKKCIETIDGAQHLRIQWKIGNKPTRL